MLWLAWGGQPFSIQDNHGGGRLVQPLVMPLFRLRTPVNSRAPHFSSWVGIIDVQCCKTGLLASYPQTSNVVKWAFKIPIRCAPLQVCDKLKINNSVPKGSVTGQKRMGSYLNSSLGEAPLAPASMKVACSRSASSGLFI